MRLPSVRYAGPVRQSGRRPPVRLTSRAWGVLVASLLLLVAGQLLGYPLLRVLAGAGLAAVLLSVGTLFRRPRLLVRRTLYPDRVECGQPALARLEVRNESGRRQPGFVATDLATTDPATTDPATTDPATTDTHAPRPAAGDPTAGDPTAGDPTAGDATATDATATDATAGDTAEQATVRVASLAVGGVATYHYELPTSRRGRLRVGPLTSSRTDAFGLAACRTSIGDTASLLVHPRRFPARPATGVRQRHHFEGPVSAGPLRGSIDLRRLREYVPGDEVRHVHWKASARTGRLMVREYADPDQPRLRLLLDTRSASLDPERFEAAVSIAASILVASARADHRVRLTTTCGTDHEVEAVGDLLDELAEVRQVPETRRRPGTRQTSEARQEATPGKGRAESKGGAEGRAEAGGRAEGEGLAALSRGGDGGALVVLSGQTALDELANAPEVRASYRPVICFHPTPDEPAPAEQHRIVDGVHVIRAATARAAIDTWNDLAAGGPA